MILFFAAAIPKNVSEHWAEILTEAQKLHHSFTNPGSIWNVLRDRICLIGVRSENVKIIHNKNKRSYSQPSATVTRILRQRLYGLLFKEHEDYPNVIIEEWCCENPDSYKEPVHVKILPAPG